MSDKERLEKRSNEFDLESFFKRIETTRDIYDTAIVGVVTNDNLIYRVDLREHRNAATSIYRRLYNNFIDFEETLDPNSGIWEKEAIKYGNVVILLSKYNKLFLCYTPLNMNAYQYEVLSYMNNLACKYNIKAGVSVGGSDEAISLSKFIDDKTNTKTR